MKQFSLMFTYKGDFMATNGWRPLPNASRWSSHLTYPLTSYLNSVSSRPIHFSKVSDSSFLSIEAAKEELYSEIHGINKGIFGVSSTKKSQIHYLVEVLESRNPTPEPTSNLDMVEGGWKLLYSTITILGFKRTKLGLRDFIVIDDFLQHIDVLKGKAVNVVKFNVKGLNLLNGQLTIEASFKITSKSRVDIKFENSTITPDQLLSVFKKNYDLLLGIFNPDGWLEITYVDGDIRIGRDNNGNIFILEKLQL